jgi:CubicO group peptidase (beta-lactamase class C family)
MQTDSVFWIASQSKPITAAALMILVDEGKVNVDDPVEKYLPEFKGQQVNVSTDPAKPELVAARHPILVREVLSHTSGLDFKSPMETPTLDLKPLAERVRFLLEDYAFYLQDPGALIRQLGFLKGLHSGEQLEAWNHLIHAGRFDALVAELLAKHYDPLYYRSLGKHYPQLAAAAPLRLDSLEPERLDLAAARLS